MAWPFFTSSLHSGEVSSNAGGIILWPVKMLLPLGFALLVLQGEPIGVDFASREMSTDERDTGDTSCRVLTQFPYIALMLNLCVPCVVSSCSGKKSRIPSGLLIRSAKGPTLLNLISTDFQWPIGRLAILSSQHQNEDAIGHTVETERLTHEIGAVSTPDTDDTWPVRWCQPVVRRTLPVDFRSMRL
jgi:hypothetical protein